MEAKEYLQQIENLNEQIKNLDDEIKDLRNEIITVRSSWPDGEIHGTGGTSPVEAAVEKLIDGLTQIELKHLMLQSQLWSKRNEIINTISELSNPDHNRLLYLRYVQLKIWEEIAVDMHFSYQWVSGALHSNALQELQKILDRN